METPSLLRSFARKWWIFALVFLATFGATVYLTMQEAPVYKAKTTYITKLSGEINDAKSISSALDILNRQEDLLGTYSEVAMSQMIKRLAAERLGFDNGETRGLVVSSRMIQGSKILEISVEGGNPERVRQFAEMVGDETMKYSNTLYAPYRLDLLDPATAPTKPISPNLTLNLVLGGVLGLFAGLGALVLSTWLRGELKFATIPVEEDGDGQTFAPVRTELQSLQEQAELIRNELASARSVIREAEAEARYVYSILNDAPKNGAGQKQ